MVKNRFSLRNVLLCIGVLFFVFSAPINLLAAPSAIGLFAFSGSETVINFNSIADEELITGQYSGSGVTFSGALYGLTDPGDLVFFPSNGGGVIASNWLYDGGGNQGLSFTATFTSMQTKVGFNVETNDPDNTTIEVFTNGNPQGSIPFDTSQSVIFIGVEDPNGFNSVTVTVQNNENGFIAIDDFRFEGGNATASIPTMNEWGMIIFVVLAGLGAVYYLRRQKTVKS